MMKISLSKKNNNDAVLSSTHDDIDAYEESKGLLMFKDGGNYEGGISLVKGNYSPSKRISLMLLAFMSLAIGGMLSVGVRTEQESVTAEDANVAVLSRKQLQIANFINGAALLRNIHITHHAGTLVCNIMTSLGPTPAFACMDQGNDKDSPWPQNASNPQPWGYNETAQQVQLFRPYFFFMSFEYRFYSKLHNTNWEYDNLVSMIVMRDPLGRFLSGGRCGEMNKAFNSGDPTNETQALFWEYANAKCADNYALRVLADNDHCVNGTDTSKACLEGAKRLLRRFTFIIDQSCLAESMVALGDKLHLNITVDNMVHHNKHPVTIRERLKNDTLYEFLQHRFRRDIELYEWSKKRSIVQCDKTDRF